MIPGSKRRYMLADSEPWCQHFSTLAERLRGGARLGIRPPVLRERMISRVMEEVPGAIHLFVPAGADQSERVLLALGSTLGEEVLTQVDTYLRGSSQDLPAILTEIDNHLGEYPLLVDGWDDLGTGFDTELGHALLPRTRELRDWLSGRPGLFIGQRLVGGKARIERGPRPPEDPPVKLVNGVFSDTSEIWSRLDGDPSLFVLALTTLALGTTEDELEGLSEPALRTRIIEQIPDTVERVLRLLAVHARPISPSRVPYGVEEPARELGCDLGLWSMVGDQLVVEPGWRDFVASRVPQEAKLRLHLDLAQSFHADFRFAEDVPSLAAISILEAHRHFVLAGDLDKARDCWRYGVNLLIEEARRRSINREFRTAVDIYRPIVQASERGEIQIPDRIRAYARHYLHFNRSRAGMEGPAETERGYRQALDDWSDNALFWSRLVHILCAQDRLPAALEALEQAQRSVEEHPQKQTVLLARTVGSLLEDGRPLDAVRVWDDYRPDTVNAEDVARRLVKTLDEGFAIERLLIFSEAPLVFARQVQLRIVSGSSRYSAELGSLLAFGEGNTPLAALRNLVDNVRQEVRQLVQTLTPDLSPRDRLRKRLLLGAVDVLASRVDAPAASRWWVFGKICHREGRLWLRSLGPGSDRELWFEIPPALEDSIGLDDLPHLALVETDERGLPTGPVVELDQAFRGSEDELWEAWRARLSDVG